MVIDGQLNDWTEADRLETPGTGNPDWRLYGKVEDGQYIFALQSLAGVPIGAGTTFWFDTDQNASTGYQIFGNTGGAEYNVNFYTGGTPYLYTGADGQNYLLPVTYAYGADNLTVEFAVPLSAVSDSDGSANVLVDVNNNVFLPGSYASGGYTLSPEQAPPAPTTIGSITLDGGMSDWSAADRLDHPGAQQTGYQIYGRYEGGTYILAVSSAVAIGAGTTIWLDTDQNKATGYGVFGGLGAEYNINFANNGTPALYTGAAGATPAAANLSYGLSADGKVLEIAIPASALAGTPHAIDTVLDINNQVFLPVDYSSYHYTIQDPSTLPPPQEHGERIGIVFSQTSADHYFNETAYSQLFMAAQNQAIMAGVPFDLLTEDDLTNVATIAKYDALVFPSFANVPLAKLDAIQDALTTAVYQYGVGLITAGNFMTDDENGNLLPGDPYARMKTLLDVTREGGADLGPVTVTAGDVSNPVMHGYTAGETIRDYSGISTSWFDAVDGNGTVLANQVVSGATHNAVLATDTGGHNVHFATEGLLADNNMLEHAIDWVAGPTAGPTLELHMSRQSALFASRTDMDQAMETDDVSPEGGGAGLYDKLLPILTEWKNDYNFVGSYYIDIGNNPREDEITNWNISTPYYQQILALGNEIGSHSYTHPEDTNVLSPAELQFQFEQSRQLIEQKLGISVVGAAVPGASETVETARAIEQYYSYISGGGSLVGAGYPGAMGYLSPADTRSVYIAPNVAFDFTLVGYQGMTAEQASAEWAAEWAGLTSHADLPVIVWPWHDYGPTAWPVDEPAPSNYTEQMFTDFIATAYQAGAEFVTLADLADRIASFDKSSLSYSFNAAANSLTATVGSADAGRFALDLDGQTIKSVTNWYAYDQDSVFLPQTGGTYTINLGTTPDDVTHITALPSRSDLLSVLGDGTNIAFSVVGDGTLTIDLANPAGRTPEVTGSGVTIASLSGDQLTLTLTGTGEHDVAVNLMNTPPTLAHAIADQAATEDAAFTFTVPADTFADTAGDTLSYAATLTGGAALPSWISFDPATRTFSGTPANGDVGSISVDVTATDLAGAHVSDTFAMAVANTNDAPTLAHQPVGQNATQNAPFTFVLPSDTFVDIDVGDHLTYAATRSDGTPIPTWLSFDASTLTFSGTPANGDVGTLAVKVAAIDTAGASAVAAFSVAVANINDAPTLAHPLPDQVGSEGASFTYSIPVGTFTDIDVGDTLSYSASRVDGSALPGWLSFDASSHAFSGTPATGTAGTLSLAVTAMDATGATASDIFDLVISAAGIVRTGGSGNDILTGGAGPDTLSGGAGNDYLDGLGGADSMTGGTGNDTFVVDNPGDLVVEAAGGGTDTVRTTLASYTLPANVEELVFTGSGGFSGTGNTLANALTGGSGNDTLDGGAGADTMTGGLGDDTYMVDSIADSVVELPGGGVDAIMTAVTLTLPANVEKLVLTGSANLNGTGNALDNWITGNSGANTLDGLGGADTLAGGGGNDTYVVDNIGDVVIEDPGAGTDTVKTTLASYSLGHNLENLTYTGTGPFAGTGNELINVVTGAGGNDTLDGGADTLADRLVGGLGDDTYIVHAGDVVVEAVGAGHDVVETDLSALTLANNVEDLIFTGTGSFSGTGNGLDNLIRGGSGNDVLNGGAGVDTMNGGDGDDSYIVDNAGDVILDSSGTDQVTVTGSLTSYSLQEGLERLTYSGSANFTATGNSAANIIATGSGDDIVHAGADNDTVSGGGGADQLFGDAGNDSLTGGAGADRLEGGPGKDILIGGAGSDTFVFDAPNGTSTDRVVDFSTAQGDKLAVHGSDYGLAPGGLAADWFEALTSAGAVGTKAHAEFIYNSATKMLYWDDDGHGAHAPVTVATFDATVTPHNTDILIL